MTPSLETLLVKKVTSCSETGKVKKLNGFKKHCFSSRKKPTYAAIRFRLWNFSGEIFIDFSWLSGGSFQIFITIKLNDFYNYILFTFGIKAKVKPPFVNLASPLSGFISLCQLYLSFIVHYPSIIQKAGNNCVIRVLKRLGSWFLFTKIHPRF